MSGIISKTLSGCSDTACPKDLHSTRATLPWGRRNDASYFTGAACAVAIAVCPTLTIFWWITLQYYDAGLSSAVVSLKAEGLVGFLRQNFPKTSLKACVAYGGWVIFQTILYVTLPGKKCTGQLTPAGNLLAYKTNGLLAWTMTVFLAACVCAAGLVDPAVVAKHWGSLLVVLNAIILL
ncbi:hypothetical protein N7520_009706 [Penicillium odoratum]|uniref:uncharacterized protein n=1 Tax=Penicillium odoratum TaxID=1167516 RepID=UPI002548862B|nr:uncharacterized protein N7520_009706 [Penicillium odoratum]KAJ5752789.1 hypothetical protein N7520_009706 [Penicillium odoratum]